MFYVIASYKACCYDSINEIEVRCKPNLNFIPIIYCKITTCTTFFWISFFLLDAKNWF